MKKLLLFAIISMLSISFADAQNFTARHDSMFSNGSANEDIIIYNWIYNQSGMQLSLRWVRIHDDLTSGWHTQICDPNLCHPANADSAVFILDAADSADVGIHFVPNNIAGNGNTKVLVYDINDSRENGIIITFQGEAWNAGIAANQKAKFTFYPSPVKDNLQIRFPEKGKHSIEIYTILGRLVMSKKVLDSDYMRLSFANQKNGMYIIRHVTDSGASITKTLVKE
jgi:hypothetical protein